MNTEISFILNVVGAVVGDKELPEQPSQIDWEKVWSVATYHNVANIIGYGIQMGAYSMDENIKGLFTQAVYKAVLVDENQKKEFAALFETFEEYKINYMPLKGLTLKEFYPSSDMRNMSDGDILIDLSKRGEIEKSMQERGYAFKKESNHELIYVKPPFIHVELHKCLIPSYNEDLYAYYGDGWKLARRIGDSFRFEMSDEDTYIYIITHFAKHYRDGGAGIKYIADIWLYKNKKNIDMEYVLAEMEKLGLKKFTELILSLADAWFSCKEFTDVTLDMTNYILASGQYGNEKNATLSRTVRENSDDSGDDLKKKGLRHLIFPTLEQMRRNYPVLNKAPYLIGFMWVWRWIRTIIGKTDKRNLKKFEYLSDKNISEFELHMKKVGLDIYNGRN